MPEPQPVSLDRAGRWFLDSGIQEAGGGVARYYRSDLRANARVSTEITGYTASALVWLHSRTGDERYLEAALRAGRFLMRTAWDSNAATLPFEFPAGGEALAYFFDLGIAARGLLRLWHASGDPEFRDAAIACAESMARDFDSGTDFHPILALPSKIPAPRDRRWSRSSGCYQLKAALSWIEIAEDVGCAGMGAHASRLLGLVLRDAKRFLDGEPERDRVMDRLHAYCYFLEGLLPYADRPECAAVLAGGIETAAALLREVAPWFERSDVFAQLLRLRLFAARLGAAPLDEHAAELEAARIAIFEVRSPGEPGDGGFCFGRRDGSFVPFVNPVSTAFCVQALAMWHDYRAGRFEAAWRALI